MLERALAVELDVFLGGPRYERVTVTEHRDRNGNGRPEPTVMTLLLGGARFVDRVYVPSSAQVTTS